MPRPPLTREKCIPVSRQMKRNLLVFTIIRLIWNNFFPLKKNGKKQKNEIPFRVLDQS